MGSALSFEQLSCRIAFATGNRQEEMFRRDILIFEVVGFFKRRLEHVIERAAQVLLGEALHFWQARDLAIQLLGQSLGGNAEPRQQGRHNAVGLRHQRGEQMNRLNLLVLVPGGNFLGALHRFLRLHSHFFESQHTALKKYQKTKKSERRGRQPPPAPYSYSFGRAMAAFAPALLFLTWQRQLRPQQEW